MVSDFLMSEWGPLHDDEEYTVLSTHQMHLITPMYSEACILFRAGKNYDGFFDNDDLLQQTDKAMKPRQMALQLASLLFFDNVPFNGLSAWKMPKFPVAEWTHHKNGPRMHSTSFTIFHLPLLEPITMDQDLYYPEDHPTMPNWFKANFEATRSVPSFRTLGNM
jgi:hypothetical protein